MDWILDTGASKHLCANKDLFQEFHEASEGERVFMGNSATARVMGKRKVLLKLTSGKTLGLLDVLYVPSLLRNLIFGSLLNKVGLKIVLEADKVVITRNGDFIGKGYTKIYLLRSKDEASEMFFKYKAEVENQLDKKIKGLRSGRGGEYDTNFLKEFYENNGSKPIKCKWIFKKKIKPDGFIDKFKARLVVVGYTQKKGIDNFDMYSPVTKISTIRAFVALSAINDLMIHQMDVKTAFLNGDLEEKIYMEQPEEFVVPGLESKDNGNSMSQAEYAKIIGSVMFLMNYTRPDIAYAVSRLSRYTHNPNKEHWDAFRRLLKYLKVQLTCLYFNKYPGVLEEFCDANWVTDNDEVSSTSGYVFSWTSAKQTCISRSTIESEFIALELAGQEIEWLRNLVGDIPLWGSSVPISLHCDSQTAIGIAKNYTYNGKRRHIRLRHGVVKELLKNGIISLDYVRSKRNLADPLTKGLTRRIILETSRAMG
ncbi:Retrovirus-related Pol polyprotein from transposon TNT 1-94 [Sesamum angolense]|uniref:Retrovirus-related Pol polyprotein from transposon TNT 1-94 n=1 Tax=Sesamum angolense TaxID=2727404 RepID=A0AAE1WVG1_9LAMI|nr:Retrovirus-related Pol polyprotein from transposon TNT 1-94 [Sesamum angolense]